MCIAIFKKANLVVSEDTLQQCYKSNSDGAGFMYSDGESVIIEKGFFTFKSFYEAYKVHESKQCLIHFRIKTHGAIGEENCHPFYINNQVGFIHNGIIGKHGNNPLVSDTRDFNRNILRPLVAKFGTEVLWSDEIKSLIETYIGYSKLVFMDVNNNWEIFNEDKGVWDSDVWYSNSSYKNYTSQGSFYNTNFGSRLVPRVVDDTTYYLEKGKDTSISIGDYCEVNAGHRTLKKGDIVKVTYISKYALCSVETMDDEEVFGVAGHYLDLIDLNTYGLEGVGNELYI